MVAPRAGIGGRFVHYVVASNWALGDHRLADAAVGAAPAVPVPASRGFAAWCRCVLFVLSMVLTWRMTNAVIGKGAAVGTAVFAGMFVASLVVLFGLQALLGIAVPHGIEPASIVRPSRIGINACQLRDNRP